MVKRKRIPKHIRDLVWSKYIGLRKTEGRCYCCGKPIFITDFDAGHNKAVAKHGSDNINNLRPICRGCNSSMGTMSIEVFKEKYLGKTPKRTTTKRKHKARIKKAPVSPGFDPSNEVRNYQERLRKDLKGLGFL